jgi:rRNA maturation protein Nop10
MKLRKRKDGRYTLKGIDEKGEETKEAHYKFVKIRDVSEVTRRR